MIAKEIPIDEVAKQVRYDPETGKFYWLVNGRGRFKRIGAEAGSFGAKGYVRIHIRPFGDLYAHRVAWGLFHGVWPPTDMQVDHINGDPLDNRISNLRIATHAENRRNCIGVPSRKKYSMHKGVHRSLGGRDRRWVDRKPRWKAQIMVNKVLIHLGIYDTEDEAAEAYRKGAEKYHGEFSITRRHNVRTEEDA